MNWMREPRIVKRAVDEPMDCALHDRLEEISLPMGGVMWKPKSGFEEGGALSAGDAGFSATRSFIEEHWHEGWSLSIFDAVTGGVVEIDCELSEMPRLVSNVYCTEHAAPMTFIGENPVSKSYVVGMTCTRGGLNIPGMYKVEDGKLVGLQME